MTDRKRAAPEALMIRLARVAGSVAGTLAAKTAKVVARTEALSRDKRPKSAKNSDVSPKQVRSHGKKKAKRAGQKPKRKPNRSRAS